MRRTRPITREVSDGGGGVRRMHADLRWLCDRCPCDDEREIAAWAKVLRHNHKLLPVFELIVENGKKRQKSIDALMKKGNLNFQAAERTYYNHRKRILAIFGIVDNGECDDPEENEVQLIQKQEGTRQ